MRGKLLVSRESHVANTISPGRFFVAHELKMMFGQLLVHYEIKPLTARPKSKWVGRNMIPAKANLEMRRRKVM